MNKLKQKILGLVTAVAAAFALGSLGALPDISPLSGLIVPAYADSEPVVVTTWADLKTAMSDGGNIRLDANVTDPDNTSESYLNVPSGVTVTLDLNGHTINRNLTTATDNGYVIKLSGNLTLTDSGTDKTGTITGGKMTGDGGGVCVNGTFTMSGGTISGCSADGYGGGVCVNGGEFTMTGGTISDCSANIIGGGVFVSGGEFTMTGGTISDCSADIIGGGGVYVYEDGTFNVSGAPAISGNTVGGAANNVEFASDHPSKTINVTDALTTDASIYVHAGKGDTVAVGSNDYTLTASDAEYFHSDSDGLASVLVTEDNKEKVKFVGAWEALQSKLDNASTSKTSPTTIKLSDDVTADSTDDELVVPKGKYVTLDLNGQTIDRGLKNEDAVTGGKVITVIGNLTLTDSSTDNNGTITGGNNASAGGGVLVSNGGIFTMSGGTISGCSTESEGGGVLVSNGGIFTMSGGTISGCSTESNGGGVDVWNGGIFTMSGGTISDCVADGGGGGVFVYEGTFNMTGGTISGCSADDDGGGVFVDNGAAFTMTDGTISGCSSTDSHGGGVYVYEDGTFTMSDGEIRSCSAKYDGGGVYVDGGGTFTMSGGTISECKTTVGNGNGGGVDVIEGTFTMSGGTISGCSAGFGGGVFVSSSGTFNVSGTPMISGNKKGDAANNVEFQSNHPTKTINVTGALTTDASIYVHAGKGDAVAVGSNDYPLKASDAECFHSDSDGLAPALVTEDNTKKVKFVGAWGPLQSKLNNASNDETHPTTIKLSGNVTADSTDTALEVPAGKYVTLDLNGYTLDRGLKEKDAVGGGNVITVNGNLTLTDSSTDKNGIITGGNNNSAGGGVWVSGSGTFTMNGGTISGCSANAGGGVWVSETGTFTMNGGTISDCSAPYNGGGVYADGTFTMQGGTISDCSASYNGGGVYVNGTLNVSGAPVISGNKKGAAANNVEFFSNHPTKTINVTGALTTDASIYVHAGKGSAVAVGSGYTLTASDVAKFASDDPCYAPVLNSSGKAEMVESWAGLNKRLAAASENPDNPTEITLEQDYLAGTDDSGLEIASGTYVNLDLNGHTLDRNLSTAKSNGYAMIVNGTLTLTDSSTGGKITGGNATFGGGVCVSNTGTFTLTGGTISGNRAYQGGGVLADGTFIMTGGTISGNSSKDLGGGVRVNGTFTMTGGTITGNTSNGNVEKGGGVCVFGGTFNLSGNPKITGNVYGGTITNGVLSGGTANNVEIEFNQYIKVTGALTTGADIGIYSVSTGVFAEPNTNPEHTISTADLAAFKSDRAGLKVVLNNGNAELVHEHGFTYSLSKTTSDNDTLVATCSGECCDLTGKMASLTIVKPLHEKYGDNKEAAANVTGNTNVLGTPTVSYQKKTGNTTWGTATTDAPTDAGTYKASITIGSKTAYVEYTIAKKAGPSAPETVSASHTDTTVTVTAPAQTAPATYEYSINSIDWQTGTEFTKLSPNTSYTIRARVAATDNVEAGAEKTTTILTSLTVTISGTPFKGSTLTAVVLPANLTDLTYQWYRGENAISGATESTYVLTEADVGSKLHVAVSMTSLINSGVSAETAEISNCAHTNTELRDVVAATCLEGGYSGDTYCANCGIKLADGHATSALGHSYSGEVTTEATCTTSGVRTYTCTRCGAVTSETISALGHDYQTYTENEVPATCTDKGSYDEVVKCSRCGKEKSRKAHTTDALGHIYKKGECIRCGAADPDYSGGEKDAHKLYVSDANGKLTGADTIAAAFRLMKDKNAAYTVFVTEDVTESALTFPTVSAITFSGTGKLTLAKTLTRLAPHSNLTIDCAVSNAAGKAIAITMPAKSTLTITANADVTLGAITGKTTATFLVSSDTEVESVTTFDSVTVAKGAALTVNNKMTGVDTLNGAVKFNGYRTTNPVKVTNIGTAEFTLTQSVVSGKAAITPITVNTVTNGLKLTVVDINGDPVTLENKTVVAKAGGSEDIAEKMTITNTDENGDPLALTMNGKNVVVTSGKAAQNVLVTGSKGFKAYAPDLTDAFALMTDKKETYTVELLNDVTESKLTFPTCAGLTLTGEGTLTLTGTTAKLAANSSLTIDCEVVNDKKKAIAVSVPGKATFTLTENAAIKLGTLTGKSNSTLLVPFDLTVESVSTFGSVTVADGATLTVTKKLASIGTLNGSVALTGFKSTNSAKITTVGTASITLPIGKVSGKNAVAKVTVSKITNGLTLNIVDAKGKPVEIETGMTIAYAGTKTDISDKITLNAVGTYTLSQSDKEIVAIAEGAKALLELDGVEYYKWGDVVKAMTDKKKDYTLKLLGDYDIGSKLTLPLHSKYKSLTIDGNGYTLTFVGTTVTLTNDTTLKNLTLTALNSTGKAVKYTIIKKNYNLTEENVNYGLGTVK